MDLDLQDVVSAFVDGEPVQANELRAALADADGREYLLDLLALRGLVRPGGAREAASVAPFAAALKLDSQPSNTSRAPRLVWTTAAAALIAVSTIAGFAAGRMARVTPEPANPPTVTMQAIPPAFSVPVPAPTRVIQLQHGKEWTEQAGGN